MDSRDIKEKVVYPDNYFNGIWEMQERLMQDYKVIEKWDVEWPLNMNAKKSQDLIKDMIARTIEEIAESYEAYLNQNTPNVLEELADALHFMMEALILAGITHNTLAEYQDPKLKEEPDVIKMYYKYQAEWGTFSTVGELSWVCTYHLNLARNALRNKPWKQTQLRYNKPVFEEEITQGLLALLSLFRRQGANESRLFEEYWKKNKINHFRIKSKY